jgi:heme exporter protein D
MMAEFLSMGGYAIFVWPSYGLTLLVMAGLLVQSIADLRRQRRLARTLESGEGARPRRAARPADRRESGK